MAKNHQQQRLFSQTPPRFSPLPKAIPILVAAVFYTPQWAQAACTGTTTVSCTGALSGSLSYGSSISEIDFLNANLAGSVNLNNPSGASTLTVTGSTLSASMQSALQVNTANGAVSLTLDAASQVVATPNGGQNNGAVQLTTSVSNSGNIQLNNAASINAPGGLLVWNNGSGSAAISNSGTVTASGQSGLGATTEGGGSINVTNAANGQVQVQSNNGIDTHSNGVSGDTLIVNNGKVSSGSASGINSTSNGGNITIQNNGLIDSGSSAISVNSFSTGNVNIVSKGALNASGTGTYAININSNGGQVSIDSSTAPVRGAITVSATNGGVQGTVGNVTSNGTNAVALFFTGNNVSASGVTLNTVAGTDISTTFSGVAILSQGSTGGINLTTNGTIGGTQAVGRSGVVANITGAGNTANVQLQINNTVNATRTAVQGSTVGSGNVSIVGNGALSSQSGYGINAIAAGGNINVSANSAVTGVTALRGSSPNGSVALIANANLTGTGAVPLSGDLSGVALQVANASQASVDNYATATTQSTTSAVVDINAGSAVVNNHAGATLTGASDFAVNGRTGNVTINNDGTLYGYVTLQGSGNAFNNNSSQSFDLRNYVAGVQSVAVAQINGVFNNNANGVLRLLAVSNPQSVNNSGAWQTAGSLLPGNGVVQGQLTGVSNFTNSGVITLQGVDNGAGQAVAGDLLVITGSHAAGTSGGGVYTSNGGQLRVDTVLNQGGAASLSDVLVLDRTALGSGGATRVFVSRAGGLGSLTGTGATDGIEIIKVLDAGNSAQNAFVLGAPLSAGAFQYQLVQADGQNWYLQSSDLAAIAKIQTMLPLALSEFGLDTLGTLWQRVGDRRYQPQRQDEADSPAIWTRAGGRWGRTEGNIAGNGFSFASAYRLSGDFVEVGADRRLWRGDKGSLIGSAFASHGEGRMSLQDGASGQADLHSNSLGLALTWYGNNGYYLDVLGKWTHYDTELAADSVNGSPDGNGGLLSLETGYQYALNRNWSMVPQWQMVWQNNRLNSYTDSNGDSQPANSDHSLMGRLGVAWRYARPEDEGRGLNAYLKADLLHSFQDNSLVLFSNTPLQFHTQKTSAELGAGGNWSNNKRTVDAYAELNYRHALGSNGSYALGGTVGVRYRW